MLVWELLTIVVLVLLNGVLAGAEIAVVAMRDTRLNELIDKGSNAALAVRQLRGLPERFLATVQVGITLVSATAGAFGGAAFAEDLSPLISGALPFLSTYAEELSFAIVVLGISYLSLVLGELVPKSLALRSSESYALFIGRPLLWLSVAARPLIWLLTASSNAVLKIFGDSTSFIETRLSPRELRQLLEEAGHAGTLHPQTAKIATRALGFSGLTAADAMVPRNEVVAVSRSASALELRALLSEKSHYRLPVYDGTLDNTVGYVSMKDLLALVWEGRPWNIDTLIRPAYYVLPSTKAIDLLTQMQRRHMPLAIVLEERGGLAGVVTVESLLEELVGKIFNESVLNEPGPMKPEPDGSVTVPGSAMVRDVNRELAFDLPEEGDYTTVAGLCMVLTGRIPKKGTTIITQQGYALEVLDASTRRIDKVRVHPPPPHAQKAKHPSPQSTRH